MQLSSGPESQGALGCSLQPARPPSLNRQHWEQLEVHTAPDADAADLGPGERNGSSDTSEGAGTTPRSPPRAASVPRQDPGP